MTRAAVRASRAARLAALLAAASPSPGRACPCQGSAGPSAAVTAQYDRVGASLTQSARTTQGAFHPDGRYAPLGYRQASLDYALLAGVRVVPEVELSAQGTFGSRGAANPYDPTRTTGAGDTTFRARWDALDEPMPYERPAFPWPAVSVVASLRAPTAAGTRSTDTVGRVGSASAAAEGLGAWEPALAVVLQRKLGDSFQLSGTGELGYRFRDSTLGLPRQLPPRGLVQVGVRWLATELASVGVLTDVGFEGDVELRHRAVPGSSQRLWTVSAYGLLRTGLDGVRAGLMLRHAPGLDGAGTNSLATTTVAVSLGYSR